MWTGAAVPGGVVAAREVDQLDRPTGCVNFSAPAGGRWNLSRPTDVWLPLMDDKTLNLWRQIESYRLRNKTPAIRRSTPPAAPERQALPESAGAPG